jgi:uncharacterized OsmC-like protein
MSEKQVSVTLTRLNNYEFKVAFEPSGQELLMDEPEPLGGGHGPNAAKVLSAAIGNCLSASLLFCLQKTRADVKDVKTTVTTHIDRNENNRLRAQYSDVVIQVELDGDDEKKLGRCIDLFEDFCIVTAAVRKGIEVNVSVKNTAGEIVYNSSDRHD